MDQQISERFLRKKGSSKAIAQIVSKQDHDMPTIFPNSIRAQRKDKLAIIAIKIKEDYLKEQEIRKAGYQKALKLMKEKQKLEKRSDQSSIDSLNIEIDIQPRIELSTQRLPDLVQELRKQKKNMNQRISPIRLSPVKMTLSNSKQQTHQTPRLEKDQSQKFFGSSQTKDQYYHKLKHKLGIKEYNGSLIDQMIREADSPKFKNYQIRPEQNQSSDSKEAQKIPSLINLSDKIASKKFLSRISAQKQNCQRRVEEALSSEVPSPTFIKLPICANNQHESTYDSTQKIQKKNSRMLMRNNSQLVMNEEEKAEEFQRRVTIVLQNTQKSNFINKTMRSLKRNASQEDIIASLKLRQDAGSQTQRRKASDFMYN